MADERKAPAKADPRPAYEPPRALKLSELHAAKGACVPGSGDAEFCYYPGSSAQGECLANGVGDSSGCMINGSAAGGYCSDGSSAIGSCSTGSSGIMV